MIGALLVTAAAVLAFVASSGGNDGPRERFVVATRDLAPGDLLTAQDLALAVVDLPPAMAASAQRNPVRLEGAVLRGPVAAGSLLTAAVVGLDDAGPDGTAAWRYRELSFALPRSRALSGNPDRGDRIDVLATINEHTEVLVQQALVLGTSNRSDNALLASEDVVLTVALSDPGEALAVAHGAAIGELTVMRSTRAVDRLSPTYPEAVVRTLFGSSGSVTTMSTSVNRVLP